ncbi:MAG: hypothetical protein IJP98_04240 [Clostridia bacterium]|nr:hypothetical protein [Clostridia bacterium]
MTTEKLLLIALIGTSVCLLLRAVRPEYAFFAAVATGCLLLMPILSEALGVTETIRALGERFGVSDAYAAVLLKMIAITYLTSFGASLCRDQGLSALAGKLEFGGRIAVVACALPSLVTLLETGVALLEGGFS